ncbi:purine-binding chemotaxis protein CheW [Bradyrhizobium japonicum USDA 38]|uniref:chemotaxis protein CheW n=1 Tax=Bradyrhizobium japonicum TaxID=375 RepID=UPI0006764054|nr:chemotaxis protein CheW [Bradyrhizobium japonicum]MCS3898434.1 purine-binding chemotaxis protein CheW [Bradyrhizobium japonicum USDA 38]MCS3941487.1 purine-binding chemotaxis protein CheW [Bradyrhizobium japonicum]
MANTGQGIDQRYLTFRSEERLYALPAGQVAEVIRITPLARVPHAPKSLLGLANLRGVVMPVASVRALLGRDETASTSTSRLIVLDGAAPVAVAVDEVTALVTVAESEIRREDADLATLAGEELRGVFQSSGKIAKILDIHALLTRSFPQTEAKRTTVAVAAKIDGTRADIDGRRRLLTLDVADQEYGLDLQAVQEIVPVPDHLTHLPGSDDVVLGVIPYRDTLLPLLSLRVLLGLPTASLARNKVVVTRVGDTSVGLVADGTRSLITVDPELVEKAPPILRARAGGETQIAEIYRASKTRLISILAPDRLFREDVMQRLTRTDRATESPIARVGETASRDLLFLAFKLNEDEFALPIEAVDEVARVPEQITRLPRTPKFLEGVVNLRGVVLPVVDQRRRFDMPTAENIAGRRLVVVRTEQHRAGLIVDSVTEVLRCSPDAIKAAPDLTGEAAGFVRSVINLEEVGRMLLLLDPSELLSRTERGLLESFSKTTSLNETGRPKR